jgi:hypothetical protein
MSEETTNLVLEHLRHIRSRVDGLTDDMGQVILRRGSMERHIAGLHISGISQNAALDRLKSRLNRVERRLELSDS